MAIQKHSARAPQWSLPFNQKKCKCRAWRVCLRWRGWVRASKIHRLAARQNHHINTLSKYGNRNALRRRAALVTSSNKKKCKCRAWRVGLRWRGWVRASKIHWLAARQNYHINTLSKYGIPKALRPRAALVPTSVIFFLANDAQQQGVWLCGWCVQVNFIDR